MLNRLLLFTPKTRESWAQLPDAVKLKVNSGALAGTDSVIQTHAGVLEAPDPPPGGGVCGLAWEGAAAVVRASRSCGWLPKSTKAWEVWLDKKLKALSAAMVVP